MQEAVCRTKDPSSAGGWPALATVTLVVLLGLDPARSTASPQQEAASFLRLETVLDGRCHILSEGGKLIVLHNDSPRTIHYRLARLYVGRPQGLMDGSIQAGEGPQKLGCDTVGGRPQTWQIKRATFAQE